MIIYSKQELKKLLLDNPTNTYSEYVRVYQETFRNASGRDMDEVELDEIGIPQAVYNAYFEKDGRPGIVGVNCHVGKGHGTGTIFHVDLAVETNVPDFFTFHHDVAVVLMVPKLTLVGAPPNSIIHLAQAEFAEQIARISCGGS